LDALLRTKKWEATNVQMIDPLNFVNWIQLATKEEIAQILIFLRKVETAKQNKSPTTIDKLLELQRQNRISAPSAINVTNWVIGWTNAGSTSAPTAERNPPDTMESTALKTHSEQHLTLTTPTFWPPELRSLESNLLQSIERRYNNPPLPHPEPTQPLQPLLLPPPNLEDIDLENLARLYYEPDSSPMITSPDHESLLQLMGTIVALEQPPTPPVDTTMNDQTLETNEESRNLLWDDRTMDIMSQFKNQTTMNSTTTTTPWETSAKNPSGTSSEDPNTLSHFVEVAKVYKGDNVMNIDTPADVFATDQYMSIRSGSGSNNTDAGSSAMITATETMTSTDEGWENTVDYWQRLLEEDCQDLLQLVSQDEQTSLATPSVALEEPTPIRYY
jgi:hypothetical protein